VDDHPPTHGRSIPDSGVFVPLVGEKGARMRYAATAATRVGVSWIAAPYLIIGGIVAATHHDSSNLDTRRVYVH
jgi:hypothetical protein